MPNFKKAFLPVMVKVRAFFDAMSNKPEIIFADETRAMTKDTITTIESKQ